MGAPSVELMGTGAIPGDAGRHWCSFLSLSEEGTGALFAVMANLGGPFGGLRASGVKMTSLV